MNRKVLIIDDDPVVRLIIQKMLLISDKNLIIHSCENGQQGLDLISPFPEEFESCIVLLDINMPVMDGWTFLSALQTSFPQLAQTLNLYLVTSSTDTIDRKKSQEFSVVKGFYSKPLSKEDVIKILTEG